MTSCIVVVCVYCTSYTVLVANGAFMKRSLLYPRIPSDGLMWVKGCLMHALVIVHIRKNCIGQFRKVPVTFKKWWSCCTAGLAAHVLWT